MGPPLRTERRQAGRLLWIRETLPRSLSPKLTGAPCCHVQQTALAVFFPLYSSNRQIPAAPAIDGGETRASPPPTSGPERPKQDGGERAGGASSAGGADAQLEEDQQGPARPSTQQQPTTIAAAAAAAAAAPASAATASAATASAAVTPLASGSTRCGGGGARGTRAGGGGGDKGRAVGNNSSSGGGGAGAVAVACEGCGGEQDDARMDKELLEAFGISVCRTCKVGRNPKASTYITRAVLGVLSMEGDETRRRKSRILLIFEGEGFSHVCLSPWFTACRE